MDVSDEENFRRFFGSTPAEIRASLVTTRNLLNTGLAAGYEGKEFLGYDNNWPDIRQRMQESLSNCEQSLNKFDRFFTVNEETGEYHIPQPLTEITKSLWATREINKFANFKSARINTRHLIDAGLMGLGLLAASAINEGIVMPLSDKAIDR